jgi:hypothetical protein
MEVFLLLITLVLFSHFLPSGCMTNFEIESIKSSFTMFMLGSGKNSHSTIQVKDDCSDTNMIQDLFIDVTYKELY